ncbi:acyl-CoA dehydrogenase family protein [Mesorhizobium sp. M1329]|uniref:acyl-CoA dehydrogenase family protein n=1 Tax=Mesorhizobium sp. M1329 TaxID=2957083 RepID=UPI003338C6D2
MTSQSTTTRWDGKTSLTAEQILDNIRKIGPLIRERADEMEGRQHFTEDVKKAVAETGVYSMGFPKVWGGPEIRIDDQIRILELLSYYDGSVGFAVNIMADSGLYAGQLDPEVAKLVYPDLDMSTAGSFNPPGVAEIDGENFKLSGRWRFGTGNRDADVILGRFRVHKDGVQQNDENGEPDLRVAWFPNNNVTRHDTWHTTGLAATGSCDYSIENIVVPRSHSYKYAQQFYGSQELPPLSRYYGTLTGNQVGVILGITWHAVELLKEHLSKAKSKWGASAAESQFIQIQMAKADSLYRASRAYALTTASDITDSLLAGEPLSSQQHADLQSAPVIAAKLCLEAANIALDIVGATSTLKSGAWDRIWRDLSSGIRHFYYREIHLELSGKHLLDLPIEMKLSD